MLVGLLYWAFTIEEKKEDKDVVLQLSEEYCGGETNETYERYVINKRNQQRGESFDTSLTSSHTLAKIYNLGELSDNLLRDHIVLGLLDDATRKKLLAEHKLTLDKSINICRANETTTKQFWKNNKWWNKCCYTSRCPQRNNSGSSWQSNVPHNKGFGSGQRDSDPPQIKCKFCLKIHIRKKELCAVWQKHCQDCGALNHFPGSSVCRKPVKSKPIHGVYELSDYSVDYFLNVEYVSAIKAEECQRKIIAIMRLRETFIY